MEGGGRGREGGPRGREGRSQSEKPSQIAGRTCWILKASNTPPVHGGGLSSSGARQLNLKALILTGNSRPDPRFIPSEPRAMERAGPQLLYLLVPPAVRLVIIGMPHLVDELCQLSIKRQKQLFQHFIATIFQLLSYHGCW